MNFQNVAVWIIVASCVVYCLHHIWKSMSAEDANCGCGSACPKGKSDETPLVQISSSNDGKTRD